MTTIGAHLLGRKVEHDPRNLSYRYPRQLVDKRSIMHRTTAPILDQGDIGSCEGNTACEWLNCTQAAGNRAAGNLMSRNSRRSFLTETDAVNLYGDATRLDDIDGDYPTQDTGTSALGTAKAMQTHKFIDGYDWTFSFPAFLTALQHQPVMLGTNWYESMFDPDSRGYVAPVGADPAGGHAYLARGVDYQLERVRCRNHWGADWGLRGEFWIRFTDLERLLYEQGDSLVPRLKGKQ